MSKQVAKRKVTPSRVKKAVVKAKPITKVRYKRNSRLATEKSFGDELERLKRVGNPKDFPKNWGRNPFSNGHPTVLAQRSWSSNIQGVCIAMFRQKINKQLQQLRDEMDKKIKAVKKDMDSKLDKLVKLDIPRDKKIAKCDKEMKVKTVKAKNKGKR
jgi:hypothetical protein